MKFFVFAACLAVVSQLSDSETRRDSCRHPPACRLRDARRFEAQPRPAALARFVCSYCDGWHDCTCVLCTMYTCSCAVTLCLALTGGPDGHTCTLPFSVERMPALLVWSTHRHATFPSPARVSSRIAQLSMLQPCPCNTFLPCCPAVPPSLTQEPIPPSRWAEHDAAHVNPMNLNAVAPS